MGYFDGLWKSSIKESDEGTVFYPNGYFSKGYVFATDKLEMIKKFYVAVMKAMFIFVIIGSMVSGGNILMHAAISCIPLLYYELKVYSYAKRYGRKSEIKISTKEHCSNLGSNIGEDKLSLLFICSLVFVLLAGYILFSDPTNITMYICGLFFLVTTILLGYSLYLHSKN